MLPKMFQSKIWITKDDRHLTPQDMSTEHIKNTLLYLEKSETIEHIKNMKLYEFLLLPSPIGEYAYDAYIQELDNLNRNLNSISNDNYFDKYIKESILYKSLEREYHRREKLNYEFQ